MGSQTQATDRSTLSLQAPCRPPKNATMPMMPSTTDLDLVNRDPNNISDHIKVAFEDVFAEPEGAHSCDCIWKNSYCCFEFCKRLTYMLLTTFYGICIAMEWRRARPHGLHPHLVHHSDVQGLRDQLRMLPEDLRSVLARLQEVEGDSVGNTLPYTSSTICPFVYS